MKTISVEDAKNILLYVADKIIENNELLTELDRAIGDADHGIGMSIGMEKVKEKLLSGQEFVSVYDVFATAGKAMLMSMGGASGVIFGSLYLAGAKGIEPKAEITGQEFVQILRRSLEAIKERGKASVGDKSMVDALEPAVIAMEESAEEDLLTLLGKAEAAAKEGVEISKEYVAKVGKAKALMERAIGHQDPGATTVWLIFRSMEEFVEMHCA